MTHLNHEARRRPYNEQPLPEADEHQMWVSDVCQICVRCLPEADRGVGQQLVHVLGHVQHLELSLGLLRFPLFFLLCHLDGKHKNAPKPRLGIAYRQSRGHEGPFVST